MSKKPFRVGDTVALTTGPDRGAQGVVVDKQGSAIMVRLLPRPSRSAVTLQLRPSSIRKVQRGATT